MIKKPKFIVVHYSDSDNGNIRTFRDYHMNHNKWSDVGYNYVIPRDGSIENFIGEIAVGSHALPTYKGWNSDSIGICVVCTKDKPYFQWQIRQLVWLIQTLMSKYGIPLDNIIGHKETGRETDCPGPIDMDKLRKLVESTRPYYKDFVTHCVI